MRTIRRPNACLLLALVGGAALSGASAAAPIVYQQDFESPNTVGKEWGQRGISNTQELGKFSNRMNNNELTLTVNTMGDQVYTLVFDLYLFGAWTGGNQNISVRAEGREVFRETFTNTGDWSQQSFARAPDLFGDLGYAPTMDSAYRGIAVEFDGRNPSVTLRFMGQGLGNMGSQSWAIDNVAVYQGVLPAAAPAVPGAATAGVGLLGAATLLRRRRRAAACAVVAGATAACATASAGPIVIYQQDFEKPGMIGPEWSRTGTDSAPALTRFSARLANDHLTLTLATTPGLAYSLQFDLYILDTWDGRSDRWGHDLFGVKIDDSVVFAEYFDNQMDSPTATFRNPDQVGQFGFRAREFDEDAIFRAITLDFTASGESTRVAFFGSGLQGVADESWGIDNVFVTMNAVPAPATAGVMLGAGLALTRRRRHR